MIGFIGLGAVNFYAISALINFLTSMTFGVYIFYKDTAKPLNQSFALFALSLAGWSTGYFFWQIADAPDAALFWSRGLMMGAIFVAITFTHFIFVLLKLLPKWNAFIFCSYLLFLAFAAANFTNYFVSGVAPILQFPYWPQPGILFHPFLALWVMYLVLCTVLLIRRLQTTTSERYKQQLRLMLLAMAIVFINGPINYLPWYGIAIPPVTTIFVSFYVVIVGYAVLKYQLMSAKVIATELLVLALWVSMFINLLLSADKGGTIVNGILFVLSVILGILLVISVRREVAQRKEIERLAKRLEKANHRLLELDKMKSEFVSIASHQLRSPLTSIRGYASMLLDGSYGNITQKAKDAIERIADSSATMASSVEDYLNVSRIEAGNMKYELVDFNLNDEVEKVVEDKQSEAAKEDLALNYTSKLQRHGVVNADLGKTRQILHNLINNAIKYTPEGTIEVVVRDDTPKDTISVDVIDSGIGMKEEELETVFEKFQRAAGANSVNVTGTGLGLFVAQKMATEMGGSITAHSDGEGKGSTFTLTLPLQS